MSDNERLDKLEKRVLDMLLIIGAVDGRLYGLEAALKGVVRLMEKEADSDSRFWPGYTAGAAISRCEADKTRMYMAVTTFCTACVKWHVPGMCMDCPLKSISGGRA